MAKLRVEVVTGEREVLVEDNVDMVVAQGIEGQLGILPRHAPLITVLEPGELRITKGGTEENLAVSGGDMEVGPERVILLAEKAQRLPTVTVHASYGAAGVNIGNFNQVYSIAGGVSVPLFTGGR
ncbi:MAG: ATP synthase F1 subunit epsilon, partial [Thermomicrobiales bacterium]